MPTFKLPKGYSFTPPEGMTLAETVPDKGYGGADISQAFDANGVHYVACNAWGPGTPSFRWRTFKRVGNRYVEVPLPFLATGRGEQDVQWYDGRNWGIAWTDATFQFDQVPGFAAFPSIPSLAARITALEAVGVADVQAQLDALSARLAAVDARLAEQGKPASDNTLILWPQGEEGGQLAWAPGTQSTLWWFADTVGDTLRIFNSAGVVVAEFRSDGLYVQGRKV